MMGQAAFICSEDFVRIKLLKINLLQISPSSFGSYNEHHLNEYLINA